MKFTGGRAVVLGVVLFGVSLAAVGGAVATTDVGGAATDVGSEPPAVQNESDDGNETDEPVRHRNPDDVSGEGDLEGVESWLTGHLSDRIERSTIQLSEGEYETAREVFDEEDRQRLGQYVDVAVETEGESQEETFQAVEEEQARLAQRVQEYRETKDEYDTAAGEGDGDENESERDGEDEERARELARELETIADEVDNASHNVLEHYETLEAETDEDFTDAKAAVDETNREIQEEQAEVRAEQLVETQLRVEVDDEEISYLDPLTAVGTVQTADGSPVANEEIRLEAGNKSGTVTTDANGTFTFEYRPTNVPISEEELEVRFAPRNQSVYLEAAATVDVSIEQVEPTVTELDVSDEVAYGDEVSVSGTAVVDDVPVDDVSLAVNLDGRRIGRVDVSDGSFDGDVDLPVTVADGERELAVEWPHEDRALAHVSATEQITVSETETELAIDATRTEERSVAVNGTLTTADGDGIDNETVHIQFDGTTVDLTDTGDGGRFSETVIAPGSAGYGDVRVVAAYDDPRSNLASTEADAVVTLPGEPDRSDPVVPTWAWFVAGLGLLLAFAGAVRWYRRSSTELPVPSGDEPKPTVGSRRNPDVSRSLLARAGEQLSNGNPDAAVQTCYAAVRQHLRSHVDTDRALTHWEFYRRYNDTDAPAASDERLLRELTEHYERAAFSLDRSAISDREAETVLERARQLCGGTPERERRAAADD